MFPSDFTELGMVGERSRPSGSEPGAARRMCVTGGKCWVLRDDDPGAFLFLDVMKVAAMPVTEGRAIAPELGELCSEDQR